MEDICESPTDLAISVLPHEDSWKIVIMREGLEQDADRCEMILSIAERLRGQFDLKGWANSDDLEFECSPYLQGSKKAPGAVEGPEGFVGSSMVGTSAILWMILDFAITAPDLGKDVAAVRHQGD